MSLPLSSIHHLPLPHFANCYSTAQCEIPLQREDSINENVSAVSSASSVTHRTRTQVLVASVHELHALRMINPAATPPAATTTATPLPSISPSATDCLASLSTLPLTCLPLGSEIISINAFNMSDGRPIVCVAAGILAQAPTSGGQQQQQLGKSNQQTNSPAAAPQSAATSVPTRFLLNIYGTTSPLFSDLTNIASDCISIRLPFVPFKLTHSTLLYGHPSTSTVISSITSPHTKSISSNVHAPDILLSGGDRAVHVYRLNSAGSYAELPLLSLQHPLPMLQGLSSAVMSIDIVRSSENANQSDEQEEDKTYLAAGCQDGLIRFISLRTSHPLPSASSSKSARSSSTDASADDNSVGSLWQFGDAPDEPDEDIWSDVYLDGPVCDLRLFCPSLSSSLSTNLLSTLLQKRARAAITSPSLPPSSSPPPPPPHPLRMLLGNAIGFGCVYDDFSSSSLTFSRSIYLHGRGSYSQYDLTELVDTSSDSVLTVTAIDINMDGRKEILIGTYSGKMLVFQEQEEEGQTQQQDMNDTEIEGATTRYQLAATKQFAHPVYSILSVDLCGDGIPDLLVTTMHSIELLRWHPTSAVDLIRSKLECMEEIEELERILTQQQAQTTE